MRPILRNVSIAILMLAATSFIYATSTNAMDSSPPALQSKTVVSVINNHNKTSDFAKLIKASGYNKVLAGKGPFTVLAPTNQALESNGINLNKLEKNPKQARNLVRRHLYKGNIPAKEVESKLGVNIEKKDGSASNGVVYVIDSVVKKSAS